MKKLLIIATAFALLVITGACRSKSGSTTVQTGKPVASATVNNLTATLSNSTGQLKQGDQEVMLAITDSSGKPVDVGAVSLNFHMAQMSTMAAMNDQTSFTTTAMPGVYRGKVHIEMAGEWQGQLAYEGPAGSGKTTFTVTAQ